MKTKMIGMALLLGLAATSVQAKTINVVTSFTILQDMVQQIGGSHVHVTTLVGPDGDPHSFEPSAKDSAALHNADVVIVSGLGLEGWMDRLIQASGFKGNMVVASTGVQPLKMEEDSKSITDPHAWNSAANGMLYAKNIKSALEKADPQDASEIDRYGHRYVERLRGLDDWAKKQFAVVPQSQRNVLTSHDAFGYFAAQYGVRFLAPLGYSTESEASAADVAALIKQIKAQGIHRYFMENQTDPRLVKQIAAATGAEPGGELYPEALSPASGPASTYENAFRHNVETLVASMK